MDRLIETLLDTIRLSLGLSVGTTRSTGRQLWLVNARSADGAESWTAKAEDGYDAAYALAGLVGFDLMDG
ncbi:MAG: hypothetical protein ACI89L_002878 [Phycisphaerales bacterium]|jgi:hypothetical protein